VAVLVVDRLEVIDVEHQQRQRPAVARAARDLALEELEEVALVVGAGQGVHDRHLVDLFVVARLDAGARQELEDRRADLQEVSVAQYRARHRHVVDVRAVGRLQVLDRPGIAVAKHARVAPRHRIAIDLDVAIRAAPEHDLVALQRKPLPHVRPRRVDQHEARFACFLRRLDDLNLGDACLPLAHWPIERSCDPSCRDRVAFDLTATLAICQCIWGCDTQTWPCAT
jgi:hypothetical protein